jgi:hypothetical protein
MTQRYLRYEIVPLEEVIDDIFLHWEYRDAHIQRHNGKWVGISSIRMKTFGRAFKSNQGLKCVSCGCEGEFFAVETTPGQESPHYNLYGLKNGVEVLFTHDHILARALGGVDDLSNTQLMCSPCNSNKSKGENKEATRRRKLKKEQDEKIND